MTDARPERDWAPHTHERRPYRQRVARGPRADRQLREVTVSLPPMIRDGYGQTGRSPSTRHAARWA